MSGCCAFLVWTADNTTKPMIKSGQVEICDGRELEHFIHRTSKRLDSLPAHFYSATGKWCYINQWSFNLGQLNFGYIIKADDQNIRGHVDVLLDRLIGLLEFFCGWPLDEVKILKKAKLVEYLALKLVDMPVLSTARLSNGELMSQVRTGLPRELQSICNPLGRKLRLTWNETASFLISPTKSLCKINGSITVDNPLANDMVLKVDPTIKLLPGKFVPWSDTSGDIPIQLGHYTLAYYETDWMPFDVDFRDNKIIIVWKSASISDEARLIKCQMRILIQSTPAFSVSNLALDPPTLSHAVSYDTSLRMIKWDFFHLVPAVQYSLILPSGVQPGESTFDFYLENHLISGQTWKSLSVFQQSTEISAGHQLETIRYTMTSSKYHLIKF